MQILGLLGIVFDAVVVFVTKSLLFFQIDSDHTVHNHFYVKNYEFSKVRHKIFIF